jgi:hypothetical protein
MIIVNMKQINRWKVTEDNVKWYDHIVRSNGKILTLDEKSYIDLLCEFNIFYTLY